MTGGYLNFNKEWEPLLRLPRKEKREMEELNLKEMVEEASAPIYALGFVVQGFKQEYEAGNISEEIVDRVFDYAAEKAREADGQNS